MLQPRGDLNLSKKPLRTETRPQHTVQDFDRHGPPKFDVVGEEHGGHTTTADLPMYVVSLGE